MATENQFLNALRGVGSRSTSSLVATLTVAGNTTVKVPITVPPGSWLGAVRIETPATISGTPTTCNVRVGTTDTGQEVVADVDAKAQGHISATVVAAYDAIGNTTSTYYVQVTSAGGTSSAGTIYVRVSYEAPVL